MTEQPKTEPRFRVGQAVAMVATKGEPVFRILAIKFDEELGGWFYAWNRRNYAAEHMLRPLRPDEVDA